MNPLSLCQPDAGKSCGACCGLYNYQGGTRLRLEWMLRRRADAFADMGKPSAERLLWFSSWVRDGEPTGKLLDTIYNCEFLGFLDPQGKRVGCLLHPAQNHGEDWRSCSFYGVELCSGHFCLSYEKLTAGEKAFVIGSLEDWYLYGICITDIDLCKAFFRMASDRLGGEPAVSVLARPKVRQAARDFLSLKVNWCFRSEEDGRFGKYCLAEDEYREARIPYEEIGIGQSMYNAIFLSLASSFSSPEEVLQAERLIDERIEAFVEACCLPSG